MKRFSDHLLTIMVYLIMVLVPATHAAEPPAILVVGDSLSGAYGINIDEGWVALLQQHISSNGYNYHVINASVSGDTSRTGLGRLDAALKTHQPAIVIVALGGNDGMRGLAFSEIETSLATMIERSSQAGAVVLLAGVRLPPNYGLAYNQQFAGLYRRLSDRNQVPLVPRMLEQVADDSKLMQADGIHPTAAGQPRVMENIWVGLEPLLQRPAEQH